MLLKGNKLYINNQLTATLKGGMIIYETCYQQEQVPFWVVRFLERLVKKAWLVLTKAVRCIYRIKKGGKYQWIN